MGSAGVEIAHNSAKVAELVDALALGASGVTRESSSLSFRTSFTRNIQFSDTRHLLIIYCPLFKHLVVINHK